MLLLDFNLFVQLSLNPPSVTMSILYVICSFHFACFESWTKANSLHFYAWQINDPWILEFVFNNLVLVFQGKYNNWDKVDPAELFSKAPTEKKEANPKLNMVKFLQVGFTPS